MIKIISLTQERDVQKIWVEVPSKSWSYTDAGGTVHRWHLTGKRASIPTLKLKRHRDYDPDIGPYTYYTYHDPVSGEQVYPGYAREPVHVSGPTYFHGEFEADSEPPQKFRLEDCENADGQTGLAQWTEYNIEQRYNHARIYGKFQVIGD
jgi:hypothetical protein